MIPLTGGPALSGRYDSVDDQDLAGTGAATRAPEVGAIAGGSLHDHRKASRSHNHRGWNVDGELGTADLRGGEGGTIEEHNRGGNEMAAGSREDEAGRQLCKDQRCWGDRGK